MEMAENFLANHLHGYNKISNKANALGYIRDTHYRIIIKTKPTKSISCMAFGRI